jgi:hypothetical protein
VHTDLTKVDSIKYLQGVNTQIRCLSILTAIIQRVGMVNLRVEQLHIYLLDWHKEQLLSSEFYKNHNGQIGEKTSKAYEYYIKFLEQIGLLVRENDMIRGTKHGHTLNHILSLTTITAEISIVEKMFWLYWLLKNDADIMLLILDNIVEKGSAPPSQADLRQNFDALFTKRLYAKRALVQNGSLFGMTDIINEYIRNMHTKQVGNEDKQTNFANKHLIPPRIEWLSDLGILYLKTNYLTENGKAFYAQLPMFKDSNYTDITINFLHTHFFEAVKELTSIRSYKQWHSISDEEQSLFLNDALTQCFNLFHNDGAMRISVYSTCLYICFGLALRQSTPIIIEINDVINYLKTPIIAGKFRFTMRETSLIYNDYISVQLA